MADGNLNAVSLFSGAGGMDVGFAQAGFEIVYANESNRHAYETYTRNMGSHGVLGDVNTQLDFLSSFRGVDCVFGGPPCQGFSVAGKMDLLDERSKLVDVFLQAVEIIRPKLFVMENVKALATLGKFEGVRRRLIDRAQMLGYSVSIEVLNAADFGVPQSRERMFMVGVMGWPTGKFFSHASKRKKSAVSTRAAIKHLGRQGTSRNAKTCNADITLALNPVLRRSPYAGMLFNGLGRPLNPDMPCSTLPASMGGNKTPIIDEEQFFGSGESWIETYHAELRTGRTNPQTTRVPGFLRRLTIAEASVLHSFPESFEFKGPKSSIYSQIGNAVPCGLALAVAQSAKDLAGMGAQPAEVREEQLSLAI